MPASESPPRDVPGSAGSADGEALAPALAAARQRQVQRHGQEREAGIGEHAAAPAQPLREQVADRPEHRRGEAAQKRDLRHGTPRLRAADPRQRGEGGVVEGEAHGDAEAGPSGIVGGHLVREGEAGAAECGETGARRHYRPAAMAVDQPPDPGRDQGHDEQRQGEAAMDEREAPAELGRDQAAEGADQVVGDTPADELRQAETPDRAGPDHPRGRSLPGS